MHSCVRGKIPVHLLEGLMISVHSCVRGRISGIYLGSDDLGAFMCKG